MRIGKTLEDMEPDFEEAWDKLEKKFEGKFEKYIPALMEWDQSNSVKAKKAHDEKMRNSKMGKAFHDSIRHVGETAMQAHWAAGWDQDGYGEWMKNEDAASLFEDLYAVKEAFKTLVESKMAHKNAELGKETLKDAAFMKIQAMFFKDMGVESWEGVLMKL